MDYAICLDQFSTNFDVNNLSSNGFSIYTNLDNYTTPIAQNIPYQDLFSPPIGNCPLVVNLPQGATQLVVIDACTTLPTNIASIFTNGSSTANNLITQCCYAIISVPSQPASWCDTSGLAFDIFSASYIGQIVAGNLTSNIGTVTDYKIGWYKDGDYSSPEFTSGYGNAFTPYQLTHPLTGNSSVPALAGDWEGIIHDIAINGTTYSSVSGSANGTPIPFESCFDTVVVEPLECDNGTFSGKYSHQFNFNSQAVGTTPAPVSLTYTLNSTTKYFAYVFLGLSVWDELEIKWKSGNPAATSNPTLYSQPIYLEKVRIGMDVQNAIPWQQYESTYSLPGSYPSNIFDGQFSSVNNTWPKYTQNSGFSQRVLTLTTLETSSNPFFPDLLEITITPNPSNNNTQWIAGFQCMETFNCTDCKFENYPNNLPKIWKIELDKITNGCDAQRLIIDQSASCTPLSTPSDFMGANIGTFGLPGLQAPQINLINANPTALGGNVTGQILYPNPGYIPLKGNTICNEVGGGGESCGPSSTGTITFAKTTNQIQLTFNLESDYLYYKNYLLGITPPTPVSCNGTTTSYNFYKTYLIKVPVQGANANCGDNSIPYSARFHINDTLNIQYVENPSTNFWSITIPQTALTNCYPQNLGCDNCYSTIQSFINTHNSDILLSPFTFTTNVGAKYQTPITTQYIIQSITGGTSGSLCINNPNDVLNGISYGEMQYWPWYSTHTIPFVSSSNGWTNLPSLGAFIPCSNQTGSYPYSFNHTILGLCYAGKTNGYSIRFPHLTSSGFDYSLSTNDFEIYSEFGFGATGSLQATPGYNPPCPDPSSSLIYSYSASVATVYTSSYFVGGVSPILIID
jgi:hypothetical protein